ncbi:MAG: glycosyltransferase, partial [Aggregatilineales bacterium]
MSSRPVISIVAPVYNEAGNLPKFYERISKTMQKSGESWELLLINDGSRDESG